MNSVSTSNSKTVRDSRHCGTVRNIHFTLVYDVHTDEVILDEDQTLETLEAIIESRFKIPVNQQILYGWPGKEPRDSSVRIKDLRLDTDVLLYVAADGSLETDDIPEVSVSDTDGAKPGTSRKVTQSEVSGSTSPNSVPTELLQNSLQLYVTDQKNGETYNEIPFQGDQSLQDVKIMFAAITGIPREFQHWSGWPINIDSKAYGQLLLQNLNLDKPYHSLFLNDRRDMNYLASTDKSYSNSTNDTHVAASKTETMQINCVKEEPNENNTESNTTVVTENGAIGPAPSAHEVSIPTTGNKQNESTKTKTGSSGVPCRTARKSTSKAALHELVQKTKAARNKQNAYTSIIGNPEGEQEGGSRPQISQTNFSTYVNESLASRSDTDNENFPENERKRTINVGSHATTPKKMKTTTDNKPSPSKSPKRKRGLSLFTSLPKKATDKILQYLDPLAHLSLRRVCKLTKQWVSGGDFEKYCQQDEDKWKKFSLTITGKDHKTFETAVNMNLPITRYVFDVTDELFYTRGNTDAFIRCCSLRLRELTLRKFFMFQVHGERELFQSLINIEKLTLDQLVLVETLCTLPCPTTLGNLQILKINYEIDIPQENVLVRPKSWDMTWSMLSDCHSLLYFRFPQIMERKNAISNNYGIFAPLLEYISMRISGGGVALEYLDLKHFKDPDSFYINRFVHLIRRCYQRDIKLKNVQSVVIQQVFDEDGFIDDEKYKFCENIVTLINYSPFIENAPLRNLEKITVDVVPSSTDYKTLGKCYKDMFWPRLRVIKIKDSVQQNKTSKLWSCWQEVQEDLYGHDGTFDRGGVRYIQINSPKQPYFLSEGRLAQRFYNLIRLDILSWCHNDTCLNKRLHAVWKKLRLQELRIENCPKLNDGSFVDEDGEEEQPFLRLTPTLKKLTLGLDKTDVTDRSLIKIFSHMRLKKFIILSDSPTKISEKALLKLRERDFGEHIEYFPFHCWSSLSIDSRRFERLGKSFRSIR